MTLEVAVSERGAAESVRVLATSGFPMLDAAAVDAVRDWRFAPARRGPREVVSVVEIHVVFRLAES